jgi:uncharacterized protein
MMKTKLLLGLFAAFGVAVGCLLFHYSRRTPDLRFDVNTPMAPFHGGKEALDYVLAHAETMPAIDLLVGASTAYRLDRLQDAGFLFYAGETRARYELKKYKPVESGGNSPAVFLVFLLANSEDTIVGDLKKRPADYAEVMDRLDAWTIREPRGFDPGWEYTLEDMPPDAVAKAVAAVHKYRPGSGIYNSSNTFDDPKIAELAEAAKFGHNERVDALLAEGVRINAKGKDGMPVLLYALSGETMDGFRRLLERGADPNLQSELGESAVSMAACRKDPECLKMVLAHGGNPNLRTHVPPTAPGVTHLEATPMPIFEAIRWRNPENVRILIKAGADLNARNGHGWTPLIQAAASNAYEAMYVLLEAGADFQAKESNGYTVSSFILDCELDPKNEAFKFKRKCMEWMERKGVDFEKEKVNNTEIRRKIEEKLKKDR